MAPQNPFIIRRFSKARVLSSVNKTSIMEKAVHNKTNYEFITVHPKRKILSKIQFKIDFSFSLVFIYIFLQIRIVFA